MLSDLDMRRCKECDKLFRVEGKHLLCHSCRGEEAPSTTLETKLDETVQALAFDIAQLTGIHHSVLLENLKEGVVSPEVLKAEESCEHCARRRKLANSDLCLSCRLELLRDLNDAAKSAHENLKTYQKDRASLRSLRQTLEEKRARTATSHINLVAAKKLKKY